MDIEGKVAVVTGGASGIGRALAERFKGEGARGVVIADLDARRTAEAADAIGALGIEADVTREDHVAKLIEATEQAYGEIDVFCANAGIAAGVGLEAPDETWDAVLGVNVRAHVIAARLLMPKWVDRGSGYWVTTASAAGIVTQIGDVTYAVSKHAAVAFAEWLSVTYGDRGIGVSCLCPMGVDTPLLRGGLEDAGDEGFGARIVEAAGQILPPEQVAGDVLAAMREERFLVLPHPEVGDYFRFKAGDYDRWLAGMRKLQARVAQA
jgi:NAD(P)-dependent dehydrogenase (short-subunit alcohol dehydrogenase family)